MSISSRKQFNYEIAVATIRQAAERWPTTFLVRAKVTEFTGGLIAVGTLANADSAGTGPEGSFRVGRQVCYNTEKFCDWLISRLEA